MSTEPVWHALRLSVSCAKLARSIAVALVMLLAASARADVYKCVTDDKTIYQDQPCGRGASASILPPPVPVGSGNPGVHNDYSQLSAQVADMARQRRRREIAEETGRLERDLRDYATASESELSVLRDKAAYAYRNQPGAIWERGQVQRDFAAEMQSVTRKYDELTRAARGRLVQLRNEAAEIDRALADSAGLAAAAGAKRN